MISADPDFKSIVITCGFESTSFSQKCQAIFDQIKSVFPFLDKGLIGESERKFPDLKIIDYSGNDHISIKDTSLLWIIGSNGNPEFHQIRKQIRNNFADKIYQCITIDIDSGDLAPLWDTEICIVDLMHEGVLLNFIHGMTCLWTLPQLGAVDLSDFRTLSYKQAMLGGFEIPKSFEPEDMRDEVDKLGKMLSQSSVMFIIGVFDKTVDGRQQIEITDEIFEAIYRFNENQEDHLSIVFGDSGWPGCLDLNCALKVTVIFS